MMAVRDAHGILFVHLAEDGTELGQSRPPGMGRREGGPTPCWSPDRNSRC